ncbi:MAG: outer membrane lipoprotein carrier protein LolA [Minicystis sp.]
MRLSMLLRFGPLACSLLAACGNSSAPAGTTGGAVTSEPRPTAASTAPSTSAIAPAASASAPIPSADPAPAPTTAPSASAAASASAASSASAKPKVAASATADAGALDAGSLVAADAGASDAGAPGVSPALVIARQVDAIYGAKLTFSAKFKQTYTIKVINTPPKESTGTVFIERPNKLSFRYDPPNKDRIVSDGTTLKLYQAESNQMTELPVAKTEYPGALAFMMGTGISRSFDFTINDRNKKPELVVLDGKPLTPNPNCVQATFLIDKVLLGRSDPGAMRAVIIIDAQENRNRFEFDSVTQPTSIHPDEFTFSPPPGTDIKRQGP